MRPTALIATVALLLAGCEMTPSRGMFTPAAPSQTRAAPAVAPGGAGTGTSTGGFDFEGEDRKEDDGDGVADGEEVDPIALQAKAMGVDPSELTTPEPKPASGAGAGATAVAQPQLPMPLWNPDQPINGSWGLRVIATLHDVQPPRAVIATADGKELVVQPGQMLPEYRMVVLAVGKDAVQVARVTPQGFYAKVETETVASMAPAAPR